MSSRIRSDVATYFDVCCEVSGGESELPIRVLYPPDFSETSILQSVRQFCFPTGSEKCDDEAVQLFTFVLTDAQSRYTFGYCRRMPTSNTCLCVLSGLTWTNHFYKFLNHLSSVIVNGNKSDVESLLTNAYHIDIPVEGGTLHLGACTEIGKFADDIPDTRKLPTLRTDKFMLEFYNAVSEKQMVVLYASILKERRIMFVGRKLSQLSSCVFALSRLLYPFYWQNLFIPILPQELADMIMAPMPYLIGVPTSTYARLHLADAGEVVVVDLDEKTLVSPHNDTIPADALSFLRGQLKSSSEMFLSDGLARSFLLTNAIIFGKYASGFVEQTDSPNAYAWSKETFLEAQRPNIQPFLSSILSKDGVQYFERFIEERLAAVNRRLPVEDEFERVLKSSDLRRFLERQTNLVRDNASEVIVALRDRVQAISIRDKIGRFTQKDTRRHTKMRSAGKSSKKRSIDPLSIDTAQYHFNNPLAGAYNNAPTDTTARPLDSGERISDAESVCSTGDLIDLFDEQSDNSAPPVVEYPIGLDSSPSSSTSVNVHGNRGMFSVSSNGHLRPQSCRNDGAMTGTSMPSELDQLLFADFPKQLIMAPPSVPPAAPTTAAPFLPFSSIYDSIMSSIAATTASSQSNGGPPTMYVSQANSFSTSGSTTTSSGSSTAMTVVRKNWETFE